MGSTPQRTSLRARLGFCLGPVQVAAGGGKVALKAIQLLFQLCVCCNASFLQHRAKIVFLLRRSAHRCEEGRCSQREVTSAVARAQ